MTGITGRPAAVSSKALLARNDKSKPSSIQTPTHRRGLTLGHIFPDLVMLDSNKSTILNVIVAATFVCALTLSPFALAEEHEHGATSPEKTVTGEVVDMMCYVDHNAVGETHGQSCGAKCIKNGGPVGIVSNGKAYLVVGEHKPINDQLAEYCGKTVTLKGKLAERGGIALLENVEVVKK